MLSQRTERLSVPGNRSFGFVACSFFALVACIPLLSGGRVRLWAVCLAASFGAVTVIKPSALAGLNIIWARFGMLLHRISSPVILAVIFFAILTPFGIIMRLFRKDTLHLALDPFADSYWIPLDPNERGGRSMNNQF